VTYQIAVRYGLAPNWDDRKPKITFWFEQYSPADCTRYSEFDI